MEKKKKKLLLCITISGSLGANSCWFPQHIQCEPLGEAAIQLLPSLPVDGEMINLLRRHARRLRTYNCETQVQVLTSTSLRFHNGGEKRWVVSYEMRSVRQKSEVVYTRQMCILEGGTGVSKVINVMLHTMGGWKTQQGRRSIWQVKKNSLYCSVNRH